MTSACHCIMDFQDQDVMNAVAIQKGLLMSNVILIVELVVVYLKFKAENVMPVNMDIGVSCLQKGVKNAFVIPWELNMMTVMMLLETVSANQALEGLAVMHVWWDTGGYHIEVARNANHVKSPAMSVILTLGDVFVLCLQRAHPVNDARLAPGIMILTKDVRNVAVTPKDLLEDSVMLKMVTADAWKVLKEIIVTSAVLAITTFPTAEHATAILQERTHRHASKKKSRFIEAFRLPYL